MLNPKMFTTRRSGLSRFFVKFPRNKAEAQDWQVQCRLIDPNDPYYYNRHAFQIPGSDRRGYAYCLGSPADGWKGQEGEIQLDPNGVAQCRSIIVPGLNQPLHDVDDGGDIYLHFLCWNWDKHVLQVLALRFKGSLSRAIYDLYIEQCVPQGTDLSQFDIVLRAEPGNGNFWTYKVTPAAPTGQRDIDTVASEIQAQLQEPEDPDEPYVMQAYNPRMTKEAITQRLEWLAEGSGVPTQPTSQQQSVTPDINFESGLGAPATKLSVPPTGPAPKSEAPAMEDVLRKLSEE